MPTCPTFDVTLPGDASDVLPSIGASVREIGGVVIGNLNRGSFSIPIPFLGRHIRGTYAVSGRTLSIRITDRPFLLPCALIERFVRDRIAELEPAPPERPDSGPIPTEFLIEVRFLGGLTPSQQDVFMGAAERWSRVIVGNLPAARLPSGEVIDDVLIDAAGAFIDGEGQVLGRAGPRLLRPDSMLPAMGMMEFDTADLSRMEAEGTLENVIVHEMGHVLGIGSLWGSPFFDFVRGAGGMNPLFFGPNAMSEFGALLGASESRPVPVANTGGAGTRDAHWRESVFGPELMTGFISGGINPLSRLTIASLLDMGYEVDLDTAEPYALPSTLEVLMEGDDPHIECCACGPTMQRPEPIMLPPEAMEGGELG